MGWEGATQTPENKKEKVFLLEQEFLESCSEAVAKLGTHFSDVCFPCPLYPCTSQRFHVPGVCSYDSCKSHCHFVIANQHLDPPNQPPLLLPCLPSAQCS